MPTTHDKESDGESKYIARNAEGQVAVLSAGLLDASESLPCSTP